MKTGPSGADLSESLRSTYATYASQIAIIDGDRTLSFAELGEQASRLAAALRGRGAAPGDRVVVISGNRAEFVVTDHALLLGGLVRVALNKRLHPREVASIIRDARPAALFCDADWASRLASVTSDLPPIDTVVCFADAAADADADADIDAAAAGRDSLPTVSFQDVLGQSTPPRPTRTDAVSGVADDIADDVADDVALALMTYTSGTTGRAKAVMITRSCHAAAARNVGSEAAITPADVALNPLPLSHAGGVFCLAFTIGGARQVIVDKVDPDVLLSTAAEQAATVLLSVPTIVASLVAASTARQIPLPCLREIIYGAAAMPVPDIVTAVDAFGPVLVQMYGQSEATLPLTVLRQADHGWDRSGPPPARLGSAGRPTPFVEIRCVAGDGTPVVAGDVGEIVVRGENVMAGYWNDPAATADVLGDDGWLRTGDLGRFDSDGYLYIVGRLKDLVISGGFNVYPTEVEEVIARVPEVAEVAVIGIPDERWGEAVCAVVVPKPGRAVDVSDIEAACRAELAGFKVPRRVEVVAELPRNTAGKILKRDLRVRYAPASARA